MAMNNPQCHRQFFDVRRGTPEVLASPNAAAQPSALLLVWPFPPDPPPHELRDGDRIDPWDAQALASFAGDVVMHVGHLEPHADRLYNSSRRFARRLQEDFRLVQRVPIMLGACQAMGSETDEEALTVWQRR